MPAAQAGPFARAADVAAVSHEGERYVPLVEPYSAAMHLGHMAAYKLAMRYAYDRQVLDIGCGTGYGTHYLASFGARRVVATDIDPIALAYAHTTYSHPRVHHQRSAGTQLPYAAASFDLVVSSQVIEHIANPRYFLKEVRRVLKPTGGCLIATPNKELFSPGDGENPNEFHVSEMSIAEFEALGRSVLPFVECVGIPQNCLVQHADGRIDVKANDLLRLEDYQVRRDDLAHCENILLIGSMQPEHAFAETLPDSLGYAASDLRPCFWDAGANQWIDLGLYPAPHSSRFVASVANETIYAPYDRFFRIDVGIQSAVDCSVEAVLRDRAGRVCFREVVRPLGNRLHLTFEPIEDSAGQPFYLTLRPLYRWLDRLQPKRRLQFEYRGQQLALWTFHQMHSL